MADRSTAPRVVREILARMAASDTVTAESVVGLQRSLTGQALRPSRHGGSEQGADEFVSQICELAALDGSLGWLAAMFNTAAIHVSTLPDDVIDAVWGTDSEAVVTTAFHGSGAVDTGGRLTGTWVSVVGAEYADWLVLPTDNAASRIFVPRNAADVEPIREPSAFAAAGLSDVTIAGYPVDDSFTFTSNQRAAAVAMAGAAAAITGSADGVWRRHVKRMGARLATSYSGDELANAAPAQVGRAASDIDATKLQIIDALRSPDAEASVPWEYEQAIARARAAADRLLQNSRHALDLDDPATRLWLDVHAGCRLAADLVRQSSGT